MVGQLGGRYASQLVSGQRRPARPSPPVELEQLITTVTPVTDITLVGRELTELRELEGELDYENPRGEVYAHAMELLEQQLRAAAKDAAKDAGEARSWGDYVAGADDGRGHRAPWAVLQAFFDGLAGKAVEVLSANLDRAGARLVHPAERDVDTAKGSWPALKKLGE